MFISQDCSFPAYFYTQPMATGPGFYDNLCPQSWQDGSAATWTLQDPHQQSKYFDYHVVSPLLFLTPLRCFSSLRLPGKLKISVKLLLLSSSACTVIGTVRLLHVFFVVGPRCDSFAVYDSIVN